MSDLLWTRTDRELGTFAVRRVDPTGDAPLLHRWLTHPKSAFWMMQDAERADVEREFREIAARPGHDAYLGLHEGTPSFLVERYDPADELGDVHETLPGDVGMHFLCAPTDTPLHGFSLAVITTVMDLLFSDPDVRRVVVEPDIRNTAVHALNEAVGFRVLGTVSLPEKDAYLSTCTRDDYLAARGVRP
ncbi:GNAT family N-acetyltransferase [Streptomyces sp. TR06-5]|uniref:GNAT family N-acetyltransferase n=1 Tax=unclassified Streptomyces TaxID=2593676 RepID=UPI0039A34559